MARSSARSFSRPDRPTICGTTNGHVLPPALPECARTDENNSAPGRRRQVRQYGRPGKVADPRRHQKGRRVHPRRRQRQQVHLPVLCTRMLSLRVRALPSSDPASMERSQLPRSGTAKNAPTCTGCRPAPTSSPTPRSTSLVARSTRSTETTWAESAPSAARTGRCTSAGSRRPATRPRLSRNTLASLARSSAVSRLFRCRASCSQKSYWSLPSD